jgi:rubredoxin
MTQRYICSYCGFAYDEDVGVPDEAIAPGTLWADVPDDWVCPDCGNGKDSFQLQDW